MQTYTLTVTSKRDPIMTFPIRPCSFDDPFTRGITLRTIDLALMLYLEKQWAIFVSPLLPSDCAWIALENPPPVIRHLWSLWKTATESEDETESEYEQDYLRLSGSETPERTSGATEADFESGTSDSESDGLATILRKQKRGGGAGYHRTVSKIWVCALGAFGHQQQVATAKELRARYDFLDCQKDLFCTYFREFDTSDDGDNFDDVRMLRARTDATEQLLALRQELDDLCAEVTSALELHRLLIVGTAYAANQRLIECAYVSYL